MAINTLPVTSHLFRKANPDQSALKENDILQCTTRKVCRSQIATSKAHLIKKKVPKVRGKPLHPTNLHLAKGIAIA